MTLQSRRQSRKSSNRWCPGGEAHVNRRACSGSVDYHPACLAKLSQTSGADSAASLKCAHVRSPLLCLFDRVHDKCTAQSGFAHIEFSSTEEALRAARHGVPHGFRYEDRLLDIDFAPWVFYMGPSYRVVHISGWPASHTRPHLLHRWASDIPFIVGGSVSKSPTILLLLACIPKYIYSASVPWGRPLSSS